MASTPDLFKKKKRRKKKQREKKSPLSFLTCARPHTVVGYAFS
jgi:hypothetical protein